MRHVTSRQPEDRKPLYGPPEGYLKVSVIQEYTQCRVKYPRVTVDMHQAQPGKKPFTINHLATML